MNGHDPQCEREVISQMVNSEKALIKCCSDLKPDDFTQMDMRKLFIMAMEMYEGSEEVNSTSFYVKNKNEIQAMEMGFTYSELVAQLILEGIDARIARLKECTKARRIIELMQKVKAGLNENTRCDDIYSLIENDIIQNTATGAERIYIGPKQMALTGIKAMKDRRDETKRTAKVIYTGFPQLNKISGGFEKGDLIIISAETGGGKSAFAMNLANHIGCLQKRPTMYLNSEMSSDQMALRWDAILSGVSHTRLRTGEITEDEVVKVSQSVDKLHNGQLYTLTIPDLQIANVLSEVRRAKRQHGIEMAVIDYIGRMDTTNNPNRKDWELLKSAAQKLKTMAQDLQMVVIMIAQLSESGRLAQASYMSHECDLWLNLTKIQKEDLEKYEPWNFVAQIRKARNADTGKPMFLRFDGDTITFTDRKKVAEEWTSGELTSESASSSDNEPANFESFAKAPTKKYRRKTY